MNEPISRSEIEANARAYLERARSVPGPSEDYGARISPAQFDEIVEKEVAETLRQLRGIGKTIVD